MAYVFSFKKKNFSFGFVALLLCYAYFLLFLPFLHIFFFLSFSLIFRRVRWYKTTIMPSRHSHTCRSFLFTFIQLALIHRHGLIVTTAAAAIVCETCAQIYARTNNIYVLIRFESIFSFLSVDDCFWCAMCFCLMTTLPAISN